MLNYVDLCWFMLFYVDLCWFMLIYFDLASSYPSVLYALHLLLAPKACYDAWSECVIEVFSIPKLSFLNWGMDFPQLHNSGIELCQFLNGVFVWKGRRLGLALRQYVCLRRAGFRDGALWICKCSKWNLRARCFISTPPQSLHTRIQDSIAIPHPGAGNIHH